MQYSELNITITDMRHLTTVIVLRNASLGDFVVVRTCIYTNLDSTLYINYRLDALTIIYS